MTTEASHPSDGDEPRGVRLHLLGQFRIESSSGVPLTLTRRAADLVAFLAVNRRTAHRRDAVAEALWPECSPDNSRTYLRRSLWQARRALAPLGEDPLVIEADGDRLRLRATSSLWIDLAQLDRAYDQVADADRVGISIDDLLAEARSALDCYAGEVLEGWDDEWCLVARERYRSVHLSLLAWVIECCEDAGRPLLAHRFCRLLLDLDPAHEWAHRVVMRLCWRAGDRTRALRQFATCEGALARELGVAPAASTVALYRSIRDDEVLLPGSVDPTGAATVGLLEGASGAVPATAANPRQFAQS